MTLVNPQRTVSLRTTSASERRRSASVRLNTARVVRCAIGRSRATTVRESCRSGRKRLLGCRHLGQGWPPQFAGRAGGGVRAGCGGGGALVAATGGGVGRATAGGGRVAGGGGAGLAIAGGGGAGRVTTGG